MATAERINWFRNLKYGMFLHYGLFTTTGRCEWVSRLDDFTTEEYAQMEKKFNPDRGIAKEWAQTAKEAGMNGHVPKPIEPRVLYETLHNILQK